MNLNITVSDGEIIDILKVIHNEYIAAKQYYREHDSSEDREGITSPDEWRYIYNKLLEQTQEQDKLLSLKTIGESVE